MMEVIEKRQSTHGNFRRTASIAQELKGVISTSEWNKLTSVQAESLEMIFTKIARIVAGDNNFADHWHDIAGYAKLAEIDSVGDAVVQPAMVVNV